MANLLLASGSPRRKELLAQIGVVFSVCPMDIDETQYPEETPEEYVKRLSLEKAQAALALNPEAVVVGADTSVVLNGKVLGKPESDAQAKSMLRLLSGRTHQVITGVALIRHQGTEQDNQQGNQKDNGHQIQNAVVTTVVSFLPISDEQIDQYVATKEPEDKAGSYGIQGKAAVFVERIEGSYSNVVGLPLEKIAQMLRQFDIPIWQLNDD